LAGTGEAWRIRVILVRFDPRSVTPELVEQTRDAGTLGGWAVDSARAPAVAAVNAGQFSGGTPWGWLVRKGKEERAPGFGPLSMAVIEEEGGQLRLLGNDSMAVVRAGREVALAFQSYPTLLESGGVVPTALQTANSGVDLAHRDSRLAIGELRDGRIILALTRFEALGGALSQLPFGPTIPEMSALMGALGCTKAVALDGGISGQMMIRSERKATKWTAYRRVPLGLVLFPSL
jgi:exopolysaccharide biosynthesis protein